MMNDNIVYVDGVGMCKVITVNRYTNGVNEPYDIYEPAYEEEILYYIETGEFQYNDFLLTNKNK